MVLPEEEEGKSIQGESPENKIGKEIEENMEYFKEKILNGRDNGSAKSDTGI